MRSQCAVSKCTAKCTAKCAVSAQSVHSTCTASAQHVHSKCTARAQQVHRQVRAFSMSGCEYIVRMYSVSITACFIARHLDGQEAATSRYVWAGTRAPPQPLYGIHAVMALLSALGGSPERAGEPEAGDPLRQ